MDSRSYKEVEGLLKVAGDTNGSITVTTESLRNIFKELKRYRRECGLLGYTEEGKPIVNDIGMMPIIRSIFEEDYGRLGAFSNFEVVCKTDMVWNVRATYQSKLGPATICRKYGLNYIEQRRPNFEYQLP